MKRVLGLLAVAIAILGNPIAFAADYNVDPLTACQNSGNLVLITSQDVVRTSGRPNRYMPPPFYAGGPDGLLCIRNHAATSGGVSLNGSSVVAPGDFAGSPALIGRYITLQTNNQLIATASGLRGEGFSVYIYYATSPQD